MNSLLKRTGIYFIGNMASKATTALIIPIYAYFVTPEDLGTFDYLQTIMTCLAPFCFLAVWEAVLRFMLQEQSDEVLNVGLSTVIFICMVSIAGTIVAAVALGLLFDQSSALIWSAAIMIAAYGAASVWQYLCRAYGESRLYSFAGAAAALVNILLIAVLVCGIGLQLQGLVISYVLGQLAVIGIIESNLRFLNRFRTKLISAKTARRFLKFSAPLAFNLLFLSSVTGFGRIIITNVLGPSSNGLYTFAMRFASIITTLGSIFSMAVIEESVLRVGSGKEQNKEFFTIIINNSAIVLLSASTIALPVIRIFYSFISETEYYSSYNLVPLFILYACCTVMATITGNVLQVSNKTDVAAFGSFAGAAATGISSILLVAPLGVFGVEIGLLLGSVSILGFRFAYGRRLVHFEVEWRKITALLALFATNSAVGIGLIPNSLSAQFIWALGSMSLTVSPLVRGIKALQGIPSVERDRR